MRSRAILEVTGPQGAGKTALVEQILQAFDGFILVARCVLDDAAPNFRESCPKAHPELRRYRKAGASGVALFTYPAGEFDFDLLFTTDLMEDYSHAVVLEGGGPLQLGELRVHVVPPLAPKRALLVRRMRDRAREEREAAEDLERELQNPDGAAQFFGRMFNPATVELLRGSPEIAEQARASFLARIQGVRNAPPPKPTAHWTVAPGYAGIEHAQVVVVNVRSSEEDSGADRLLADLARIRKDPTVFKDVLGWRGRKTPITAVAADLSDPRHPGTKKAVARLKRAIRQVADE